MNAVLPPPRDAQMLLRLRSLRVQRARTRCNAARAEAEQARRAVRERTLRIERIRHAMDTLTHAVANSLAPRLPRWGSMVGAQRDRLADCLDRDEFDLRVEQETLREAEEQLEAARAALACAVAREDALRDVARQAHRADLHAYERRTERELEDRGSWPTQGQPGRSA